MLSRDLLQRLVRGWDKRARVRSTIALNITYESNKVDFLDHLLPFANHHLYQTTTPMMRKKILACGWIIYNAKTIAIETDIVHPVCLNLLNEKLPGCNDFLLKQLITETMVDESYHIHLCAYANEITKEAHDLNLRIPTFGFLKELTNLKAMYTDPWQKDIVQLAAAITSEIYITDYLDLVHQENQNIQPLNSLIVKTHRSDELAHGKIFNHLAHVIFNKLKQSEKDVFKYVISKPLQWLTNPELDVWHALLRQIAFPNADEMINDCKLAYDNKSHRYNENDSQDLNNLIAELGINLN